MADTASTGPAFKKDDFSCPICGVYARMLWTQVIAPSPNGGSNATGHWAARCTHCKRANIWYEVVGTKGSMAVLVDPSRVKSGPAPHENMPAAIAPDFEEARTIAAVSPRGAAALLRLVVQKLCGELGEDTGNLNNAIGNLVHKGLPVEIQQALDVVRVIGNNAVHPGQIATDDVANVADQLFQLVNFIVEDRIARPQKVRALFEKLPAGAKEAIAKRDGTK